MRIWIGLFLLSTFVHAADGDRLLDQGVKAVEDHTNVQITVDGRPVLTYHGAKAGLPRADIKPVFERGGYIHPVLTPTGQLVSDDYPPNHLHHHGIWFSWTDTTFEGRHPDFWNMGESKGTVEFVKLSRAWSGPTEGGFAAEHRYVDLQAMPPKAALDEKWEARVYAAGTRANIIDISFEQRCASESPLELLEYRYGGLGFRGRREWDGATNMLVLTSEGETNRVTANTNKARWCWLGGKAEQGIAGIAIFCHPLNFRAPQPMRVHPTEPFFCYAPSQGGDFKIEPNKQYLSRYRFVVLDGPPNREELEGFWREYTASGTGFKKR